MEFLGDLERIFASAIYPNRVAIAVGTLVAFVLLAIVARRQRWDRGARRHPRATVLGVLLVLAIGGPLGWYLGSPLFLTTSVDEAPPPVTAGDPPSAAPSIVVTPTRTPGNEPVSPSPVVTPTAEPIERTGSFSGADEFHFGNGTARLIETGPGAFTVRLEDFAVRNGPDLFVYLSPSADGYVDGAIELGRLKADRGNQNYEVPPGADTDDARSVVIWCRQFAVLFATAPLS